MVEDGFPPSLFKTQEERKAIWEANPPRPLPLSFGNVKREKDPAVAELVADLENKKSIKTKNRMHKMLSKKEDRTGQRWDSRRSRWVNENELLRKPMIVITTNTRGSTKMTTKDYAEMSLVELANAYNKISGKEPIKKFKDKATGLKRMAELQSAKAAAKAVAPKLSEVVRRPKPAPKEGSANKRAAEFSARVGSFREKLLIALDESFKKMIPELELLKAVYGSKNTENAGALTMVIKGAQTTIEKNKLPYALKKEKNEAKEISYGLFPK